MNWDSWLPPKNSRIDATTGRMLVSDGRRGRVRVRDRHALFDDALHAQQADAELVLDQLAHGAHATVAEVVDVVRRALAVVDAHHLAHDLDQVLRRQDAHR